MMRELEGVCCSAFGQKKSRMARMPPLSARAACEIGGNESPGSRLNSHRSQGSKMPATPTEGSSESADTAAAAHAWICLEGAVSCAALPAASRHLSRAYTLHAALARLGLLVPEPPLSAASCHSDLSARCASVDDSVCRSRMLRLILLGADEREGCTHAETARVFGPLCGLLAGSRWKALELLLCGPNCRGPPGDTRCVREALDGGGAALSVRYAGVPYHELTEAELGPGPPTLAVAFQGGLWGYDSWAPTITRVLERGCPLLVTSYNLAEAEDDEDSLQTYAPLAAWHWMPEPNPWRSLLDEREQRNRGARGMPPTETGGSVVEAPAETLHENCAWQCLVPRPRT